MAKGRHQCKAHVVNIRSEEARLTTSLGAWAGASIATGAAAWTIGRSTGRPALEAFGRQTFLWGAIDGAIAGAGALRGRRPRDPGTEIRDAQRLRRILLINAAADVAYVAAGMWLMARPEPDKPRRLTRADGAAIVIQGGFLLALDTTFAARVRQISN